MENVRTAHWVTKNHQERMPYRMVAFDTEAKSTYDDQTEVQDWRVGCAIRWRTDLRVGDKAEAAVFDTPETFWRWVSDFCRPGTRTVVWAHNLGYDVRISRMFAILPTLGYHLEWCNLDRNISSATWRSDHGTIVLADTWTWLPMPLKVIAEQEGMVKYDMPPDNASADSWARYCMHDCEILYRVVGTLVQFIKSNNLGNWQPTGAGMAYATWRHKFLSHKILVHDDTDALHAERYAMHTGRAEAWKHGEIFGQKWTEVDLKNAYVSIAANNDLPRKLHMHHGPISVSQYRRLNERFAVLCRVAVSTDVECLPMRHNGRHVWPIGKFETWVWDCELDLALKAGAHVSIKECYTYVRDPILSEWAKWVLSILYDKESQVSPVVRTWVKHCARALIGRLSLRAPSWEYFGANIDRFTGITHITFPEESRTTRMLHVGEDTLIETGRTEGKDSMPSVTGWIMAKCRTLIWDAIQTAGAEHVAHVDTDSVLVDSCGLDRIRSAYGSSFLDQWSIKGTFTRLTIYGPRCYWRDKERKTSGIPLKAEEVRPGEFMAERWSALASDLERGETGSVTIAQAPYVLKKNDPRRADSTGVRWGTRPYAVAELA